MLKRNLIAKAILMSVFIAANSNPASANYRNNGLDYVGLCQHAESLKYISGDLKAVIANEFRGVRGYGKMISRAARIKTAANRIHRRGTARSSCDWNREINRVRTAIYELDELISAAVLDSRSGYSRQICPRAIRTVRGLLRQANRHVLGLERALVVVQRPRFYSPAYTQHPPIWHSPNPGIGQGVYRSGGNSVYHNSRVRSGLYPSYVADSRSSQRHRGVSFDRGGLQLTDGGVTFRIR